MHLDPLVPWHPYYPLIKPHCHSFFLEIKLPWKQDLGVIKASSDQVTSACCSGRPHEKLEPGTPGIKRPWLHYGNSLVQPMNQVARKVLMPWAYGNHEDKRSR